MKGKTTIKQRESTVDGNHKNKAPERLLTPTLAIPRTKMTQETVVVVLLSHGIAIQSHAIWSCCYSSSSSSFHLPLRQQKSSSFFFPSAMAHLTKSVFARWTRRIKTMFCFSPSFFLLCGWPHHFNVIIKFENSNISFNRLVRVKSNLNF